MTDPTRASMNKDASKITADSGSPDDQTGRSHWTEQIAAWLQHRRLNRMNILPREDRDIHSLIIVIAVMCYLASLAAGALIGIDSATDRWTIGLTRTTTLRLKPPDRLNPIESEAADIELEQVMKLLGSTEGVVSVKKIDQKQAAGLLEPWLGKDAFIENLPIPELIDIRIDPENPPDLETLEKEVRKIAPSARIEDHTKWNDRILAFAGMLQTIVLMLLMVILVTLVIIITYATRAWMTAKHEIVEVLHMIGARDRFIAKEFQKKFLRLGLIASAWGLGAALVTFAIMALVSSRIAVLSSVSVLPPIKLDLVALLPLLLIPASIALLTTLTARITVTRILKTQFY